nr:immunoglobulin light chain junction region [Macaca mulatta]MOW07918.1 immunoglobulin light chain junction region [Macaca mulatta]MOW08116.1 immunoglobulin light chain junction region [Macaca mulatta]MOW08464.1 immunoglobulin light chain junction region [Macaca mulatta]MOW08926.1 immunoglobulin light chain junction region [Macaca mulatta]
CQQYYYYPYSF